MTVPPKGTTECDTQVDLLRSHARRLENLKRILVRTLLALQIAGSLPLSLVGWVRWVG